VQKRFKLFFWYLPNLSLKKNDPSLAMVEDTYVIPVVLKSCFEHYGRISTDNSICQGENKSLKVYLGQIIVLACTRENGFRLHLAFFALVAAR